MQPNSRFPLSRAVLCFALTTALGAAVPAVAAPARANVTPLVNLGASTVGQSVRGDLLLASDGHLYAVASTGADTGYGGVIKVTPSGTATVLHAFAGPGTESSTAYAGVIQGTDGALYGTSYFGGAKNLGTVYRVTLAGEYTNLFSFTNDAKGGFFPYTGVTQAPNGDLYGTTLRGGDNDAGTVYRITTGGTLTSLVSFDGPNGKNPEGKLVVGPDGALYGTTLIGGEADRGTIYRITTDGALTTLYSFPRLGEFNAAGIATNDIGANPRAGLIVGADGNFYGTAYQGGTSGYGTVFRMTPAGAVTVLHSFAGPPGDGSYPLGAVAQMPDGSLVGTTEQGGYLGTGITWRIDPAGNYEVLHSFTQLASDGMRPYAALLPANGYLYGVTFQDRLTAQIGLSGGVLFREELATNGVLPVTLTANPETMTLGASATLTWNAPTSSSCTAADAWTDTIGTSGTLTVTPKTAGIQHYVLSCTDGGGVVRTTSASVIVTTPALEPVDAGSDSEGGGGAFPILGLALLGGTLALSLTRKRFLKDAMK